MNKLNEPVFYERAKVIQSMCKEYVVIGEDSFVQNSILENHVEINRRNMIIDSNINSYTYTGANTIIKKADIGKFCSISWNVSITGNLHEYTHISTHPFTTLPKYGFVDKKLGGYKRITIENDVWIGMNTSILPGIKIENGAVVGAGSVVTKDIPPYAIVAGNPAKVIKYRFEKHIIECLQEICWWDWSEDRLRKYLDIFREDCTYEKICEIKSSLEMK